MQPKRDVLIKTNWREWRRIPQGCLGASDPQIWVEDGVDQGGIWCEEEEGREKSFLCSCVRPPPGRGWGWVGWARAWCKPTRARRKGPWRLAPLPRQRVNGQAGSAGQGPDARDPGVCFVTQTPGTLASPEKVRNEIFFGTRSNRTNLLF